MTPPQDLTGQNDSPVSASSLLLLRVVYIDLVSGREWLLVASRYDTTAVVYFFTLNTSSRASLASPNDIVACEYMIPIVYNEIVRNVQ